MGTPAHPKGASSGGGAATPKLTTLKTSSQTSELPSAGADPSDPANEPIKGEPAPEAGVLPKDRAGPKKVSRDEEGEGLAGGRGLTCMGGLKRLKGSMPPSSAAVSAESLF